MKLSSKAKTLLMRAYASGHSVGTFDDEIRKELLASGLMKYEPDNDPLMVLTEAGDSYAEWESGGNG
jgi:hypothetical protein